MPKRGAAARLAAPLAAMAALPLMLEVATAGALGMRTQHMARQRAQHLCFSRSAPMPWDTQPGTNPQRSENPRLLKPGARVAVSGAEGTLGRLLVKRLFQSQYRPYLIVPDPSDAPRGLGLEQYRGLTRYIAESDPAFPPDVTGLILARESGYSPQEVKHVLSMCPSGQLKRMVLLSSNGVERRGDWGIRLKMIGIDLDQRHAAEDVLKSASDCLDYTIVRAGRLRGGGGEHGLGYEFYDGNRNPLEAHLDESFDSERCGFTMSFSDNVMGETSRILMAEVVIKALSSDGVTNTALSVVSEPGRNFPSFDVAPWEFF